MVGQFVSKEALAAVGGTTGTLINLLVGFFVGLSSGATVIISQYYGARRPAETSEAVHTAMGLGIAGGVVFMAVGLLLAPAALRLMATPDEIFEPALSYIRIYFLGMVFNLVYNMGAGILRAVGDARHPLYFLIFSTLLNIVLDLLFVVAFHMGVNGAGRGNHSVPGNQRCACALHAHAGRRRVPRPPARHPPLHAHDARYHPHRASGGAAVGYV